MQVKIDEKNIPNNNIVKILSMHFKSKMNWIHHSKHFKANKSQKLNKIKMLSHTQWGGERANTKTPI